MAQNIQEDQFAKRAKDYDRLQPVRLEMYHFYHQLALDFIPFDTQEAFRMLDLGCGTATFLNEILEHYPNATCDATDYSLEMLKFAAQKTHPHSNRVTFHKGDLNNGLPKDLSSFQLVTSFSALHHLTDENKIRIFKQIYDVLENGGWFFLIDAMSIHFDNDVFSLGRKRSQLRQQERLASAGINIAEEQRVRATKTHGDEDSPQKDRISSLSSQLTWMKEAGFQSVDHIWHFWMEHFIICRK